MISRQMDTSYRIGTSGYSYKDWEGVFYPPGLPNGQKLDFYAQHFDTVEINSTYYSIPNAAVFYHLQRKTPEDFEFIVKTHRETTHGRENSAQAMQELLEALKPLIEADKLKGLLAQFPYSFKNTPANRDYLLHTKELAGEIPLFVEFRNWTWNRPEVFEFLQAHGLGYVNVDQPRLRGLLPPQNIATTDLAYVRFHGRNRADWWEGTNETRYNYLYSEQELNEWLRPLVDLIRRSRKTYIFFNNHPQGKAVQNARMLKTMLARQLSLMEQ
ncbi:MAG: DUF72 domain-containing protein [Calditrichaeota bacterium]|nr:MAG: DUF72 domain-containing protein [Calditrichota bacterium]